MSDIISDENFVYKHRDCYLPISLNPNSGDKIGLLEVTSVGDEEVICKYDAGLLHPSLNPNSEDGSGLVEVKSVAGQYDVTCVYMYYRPWSFLTQEYSSYDKAVLYSGELQIDKDSNFKGTVFPRHQENISVVKKEDITEEVGTEEIGETLYLSIYDDYMFEALKDCVFVKPAYDKQEISGSIFGNKDQCDICNLKYDTPYLDGDYNNLNLIWNYQSGDQKQMEFSSYTRYWEGSRDMVYLSLSNYRPLPVEEDLALICVKTHDMTDNGFGVL